MRVLAALFLLAISLGGAEAQTSGTKEEQAACRPDVRRLCGKIGRGDEGKYSECLRSRFQELSQKCQQVLMDHPG